MKQRMIEAIKSITPPIALDIFRRLTAQVSFTGNYLNWNEASRASSGYDADVILNKVRDALLKVKQGEAVFERDSVLFDKIQYSWPLLAGLLWVTSRSGNKLNLLDFGGSLGSCYYQNLKFLKHLDELKWSIVEQKKFVACGKRFFENEHLKFYDNLASCIADRHPDVILFSSVIQYLEKPYDFLGDVLAQGFSYIIFDRTPFLAGENDRLTIQKVAPEIYPASYPAWFFNLQKFLAFFARDYSLVEEFDSFETFNLGDVTAQNKGFIFLKMEQ